jgi:hypothetical protein
MARKSLFATLLGVAALAVPSAFADKAGVPHQGSNGQGRPADQTQTTAQAQTQGKALAKGHAKTHAKAQAKAKGHAKVQVKAQGKVKAHTQGKALAKGHAKTQSQTQATANVNTHAKAGKTTICHATGSATNPYVTITISNNAIPAHQRHQDGRDIVPAPGTGCPTTSGGGQVQPGTTPGTTPGATQQEQTGAAPTTGASTTTSTPAGQTGVAGESTGATNGTSGSSGSPNNVNVLGASTSGSSPSASSSPAATATRSASSSKLPFTGTDAIIVAILGLALLLAGLTARRVATTNRAR